MSSLDISIVIFALVVVLILDVIGMGLKGSGKTHKFFYAFALLSAIAFISYFTSNYSVVSIGTIATIPFQIFIIAWLVLPIGMSFILLLVKNY